MLNPASRLLYIDALRPPEGYVLDRAVGTTFSLDLTTALTIPLSMAAFEWREGDAPHPLALLETLRRVAPKVVLFCQQGRIMVPPPHNLLYSYLESSVVEVRPAGKGVFHPKVWLLRFVSEKGEVLYRFLCLSRNLTFDRSWDTILCLEGNRVKRRFARNRPLAEFIRALPSLAVRPVPALNEDINNLAEELAHVDFEPPAGFRPDFQFRHLGLRRYQHPVIAPPYTRLLVMSPFLSPGLLDRLTEDGSNHVLISRQESLDQIDPAILQKFEKIYTMDDAAVETEEQAAESPASAADAELSGLHAKLFIAEQGRHCRIWTGSANATTAAFGHRNIEFLVELQGTKRHCGIDRLLQADETETAFSSLLQPYQPGGQPVDPAQEALESMLNNARTTLTEAEMQLVASLDKTSHTYNLCIQVASLPSLPQGVTGSCWPITLDPSRARPIGKLFAERTTCFDALAMVSLTSFVAFELQASVNGASSSIRFVLNLPLIGDPAERPDRILSHLVSDRDRFIRYILLLLAEGGTFSSTTAALVGRRTNSGATKGVPSAWERPLLEELVRAFSRSPEKLGRISKLVDELKRSPEGAEVIPEGFDQIWRVFAEGLGQ